MQESQSHFAVSDVVLRRFFLIRQQGDVPCTDDVPAAVGVGADGVDDGGYLIVYFAVRSFPGPPLGTVDRAEITVFGGPFVPDGDLVVVQVPDIRAALQEPEQFADDGTDVQALGGQKRKTVFQVVPDHPAEDGAGTGSGTVALVNAKVQYFLQQVQILTFHFSVVSGKCLSLKPVRTGCFLFRFDCFGESGGKRNILAVNTFF